MKQEIEILFENDDILIINKPSGITVHNDSAEKNVLERLQPKYDRSLHLIHRLDRETSGVLALAKNPKTANLYMSEFENHTVSKKYLGIVCGKLDSSEYIKWSQSMTDEGEGRRDPCGPKKNHKDTITHVRSIKGNSFFTLCEFDLKTGRQHQIRKHSVVNGHALVGDERYGNPKYNEKIKSIYGFGRLALHCSELKFSTGEQFFAPAPTEFALLLK